MGALEQCGGCGGRGCVEAMGVQGCVEVMGRQLLYLRIQHPACSREDTWICPPAELVRLAHPYITNGFFLVGTGKGGNWRSLGPQFLVGLSSRSFTKPELLGLTLKEQSIRVPVNI